MKNKIVLITGASSGIGASCAKAFAAVGAKVILCARRVMRIEQLAFELKEKFAVDAHVLQLDVSRRDVVESEIAALPAEWQNIDVLINNAGLAATFEKIQDADVIDWETMIDTNIKGVLYMTKAVLPVMLARRVGHIINIGSIAGHEYYPNGNVYCATKHALDALTKCLRIDLLGSNIRVSTVDPGMTETEFSLVRFKGDEDRAKNVYAGIESLTSDDIADAVLYCATRPPHVNIAEVIMMPTDQASTNHVFRTN